jgi:hypothetical protein
MPGNHKGHPTIAFRPDSQWQYDLIDERARLSGLYKKDFIMRSCIYSNICVVGKKENIQRIIDAVQEMQIVMKEIVGQLKSGDFNLTDDSMQEIRNDLLTVSITAVDILNGAAYLFQKEPVLDNQHWKAELELEQLRNALVLGEEIVNHDKNDEKDGCASANEPIY